MIASVGKDGFGRFSRTSKPSDYFLLEQENVEPAAPWSSVQVTLHNTYQRELRLHADQICSRLLGFERLFNKVL